MKPSALRELSVDELKLKDQDLIQLTAAARAGGSRWEAIAACGVNSCTDLGGVIYRITGETGAEPLFYATRYAVEPLTGTQRRYTPLTWACPRYGQQVTDRAPAAAGPPSCGTAMPWLVPAWPGTRPPMTSGAAISCRA